MKIEFPATQAATALGLKYNLREFSAHDDVMVDGVKLRNIRRLGMRKLARRLGLEFSPEIGRQEMLAGVVGALRAKGGD